MSTQPIILDHHARPLYLSREKWPETTSTKSKKFSRPVLDADMLRQLSPYKHRMLVSDARFIGTTFPLVAEAVKQKARYVSTGGWDPVFTGQDEEWGKTVTDYLKLYHQSCNVRGSLWNWNKIWSLASRFWDIDSDFFIVKIKGRGGFPKFQVLESHRVGQRNRSELVTGGVYDGLRMYNGIIYDSYGKPVAYNVQGASEDGDLQVAARHVYHVAAPNFYSDGRPFPNVAYAVLDWYDVKLARGYQKTKQAAHSALTIVEKNGTGMAPLPAMPSAKQQTAESGIQSQLYEDGLVRYVRAGDGELSPFESKTPSNEWLNFDQTLIDGAFYSMGWHVGMFDLSKLRGAAVRGFEDQINAVIQERHRDLKQFAIQALQWEVARLIVIGELPESDEWMSWDFRRPLDFTVDWRHRVNGSLDLARAGGISMQDVISKFSRKSHEDVLREQAEYERDKRQIAQENNLEPAQLGTLTMPGDPAPPDSDPTPENPQPDETE